MNPEVRAQLAAVVAQAHDAHHEFINFECSCGERFWPIALRKLHIAEAVVDALLEAGAFRGPEKRVSE